MDQGKLKDLQDVLLAYRLIDQSHDIRLISDEGFATAKAALNDKAHTAIAALLT